VTVYKALVRKAERGILLGRLRLQWEVYIRIYLQEIDWEDVNEEEDGG